MSQLFKFEYSHFAIRNCYFLVCLTQEQVLTTYHMIITEYIQKLRGSGGGNREMNVL